MGGNALMSLAQGLGRSPPVRYATARLNRLLARLGPWPIRVAGVTLYAATIDRILALRLERRAAADGILARLWQQVCRPGAVVLDVGANLGLFSFLAAQRVGPTGLVWAFEPDPLNRDLLERGIILGGLTNVTVAAIAVTDHVGRVRFAVREEHRGDCHIATAPETGGRFLEVAASTLDATLRSAPRVDVIKLDIQGAEPQALRGMMGVLAGSPDLVVFSEFWPKGLRRAGTDPAAYLALWREQGFQCALIDEQEGRLVLRSEAELMACAEERHYVNLLLTRPARLEALLRVGEQPR